MIALLAALIHNFQKKEPGEGGGVEAEGEVTKGFFDNVLSTFTLYV